MQTPTLKTCVLCTANEAVNVAHIPAKMFFAGPLPNNMITVPSCVACNQGIQQHEEYLRAWLMLLRDSAPSPAVDQVRDRARRQLDRSNLLRSSFLAASEFREEVGSDGRSAITPYTRPDRGKIWATLTNYARGLHFWSSETILPAGAIPRIERIFNRGTRPDEYWEPLLAAANFAAGGTTTTVGTHDEFQLSFRSIELGDAISVIVMDFYQSFPFVAIMLRPGTDINNAVRLPF